LKHLVSDFINKIKDLESVESGLMLIKYHIENQDSNQDLELINGAYSTICIVNKDLIRIVHKFLMVQKVELISNQLLPEISLISQKITSVVDFVKKIAEENVPGKSEMIGILESCLEIFSEKKFVEVFLMLESDKSYFRQQILELEDRCEEVLL
jgi:hypothetical protein